ncbi:MAG: hypothetical protein IJE10_11330 [Clostridia bacterium]|nr:hypothetical protein [Clostridia bacterium]
MRDRLVELINQYPCMSTAEDCFMESISSDLADYLIANGVIVPPCNVGDVVYVKYYGEIVNAYVTEFEINSKGVVAKVYIDPDTDREYDAEDIYITKEEAEEALKRKESGYGQNI